jgi:N-acetyl-gamma-glutamyl-phosphate reductase
MKIGLVGGSGYAGGELLRLLALHPHFEVTAISAHSNADELITAIHPQLQSYAGRHFHLSPQVSLLIANSYSSLFLMASQPK